MLEQAAERQRGGTDAGLQPGRVEIVDLPAEGRPQPVERTGEVLDLAAGQRRFPRVVTISHGATVAPIPDVLRPDTARWVSVRGRAPCCRKDSHVTSGGSDPSYLRTDVDEGS